MSIDGLMDLSHIHLAVNPHSYVYVLNFSVSQANLSGSI